MKKRKYIIKAKMLQKDALSSIVVWISENDDDFNEKHENKTLSWIGYNSRIKETYTQMNNNAAIISEKFIAEFRKDYQNIIHRLEKIAGLKIIQLMCMTIELYICSVIIKFEMSESFNSKALSN